VSERIIIDRSSEDWERRMEHARAVAQWELGDPSWAGRIVGAFLWPDPDALAREMGDDAKPGDV
jgi:hypothetical protein